jgi:hypothetical protein
MIEAAYARRGYRHARLVLPQRLSGPIEIQQATTRTPKRLSVRQSGLSVPTLVKPVIICIESDGSSNGCEHFYLMIMTFA